MSLIERTFSVKSMICATLECPICIKFLKEDGVASNVTCFRDFGKKHMPKFFEGSNLLIPMVNPHIDMTTYPIFG